MTKERALQATRSSYAALKKGTGKWYTEQGTYTEPSNIDGMEWICRCGKRIALVPITKGEEE